MALFTKKQTLFFLILFLFSISICNSQTDPEPVYFDSNENILTIDKKFNATYQIFDHVGFQEARAYKDGNEFLVTIVVKRSGKLVTIKEKYTHKAFNLLRRLIDSKIESTAPTSKKVSSKPKFDTEGRGFMITGGILMSLYPYGLAIPTALGLDNDEITAGYLITAAGGIFGSIALANNSECSVGQAYLFNHGLLMGFVHGLSLYSIMVDNDNNFSSALAFGTVFGLGEAIVGYNVAHSTKMRDAVGSNMFYISLIGSSVGVALVSLSDDPSDGSMSAGILLGSGAGMLAGGLLADENYTAGDPIVVFSAALSGGFVFPALYTVISNDADFSTGMYLLGTIGGIFLADQYMIKDYDFDTGTGLLCLVGTIGGFIGGIGISNAVDAELEGALFISSVTTVGGLLGMYYSGREANTSSLGLDNFDLDLNPGGFFADKMPNSIINPKYQPVVTLSYNF